MKASDRRARILEGPIGPTLLRLSVPTVLASLVQVAISIVEGHALGRIGTGALAGAALVFPLFMLTTMLSAGAIGGAVSGAMARASGAGDEGEVARVIQAALVITIGGAAVMGGSLLLAGPAFFQFLGGSGAALQAAVDYGSVFFPGMITLWAFNMTSGLLRGSGDMVRPMIGIIVVTLCHAAICGFLVEQGGMAGAAWAVVIAYGVGAIAMLGYMVSGRAGLPVRLSVVLPWTVISTCLRAGLLAGTQSVLTVGTSLLVAAIAGRLGTEALAGYGIGARLELLMVPIIFGVGAALIAMVGGNAGAGHRDRAIRIGWIGSAAAAALVGAIGVIAAMVPAVWIPLFTNDPAVAEVARTYLAIVGPCYAFFGLGLALYFASQGLATLFWPVFGSAVRLAVIGGGLLVMLQISEVGPTELFGLVALGMIAYGVFNGMALRIGPWRA